MECVKEYISFKVRDRNIRHFNGRWLYLFVYYIIVLLHVKKKKTSLVIINMPMDGINDILYSIKCYMFFLNN